MRVAAVMSDLMLFSRIDSAATAAGASLIRVDSPSDLPDDLDLVLVDWSARRPAWADASARPRHAARSSSSAGTPISRPMPPRARPGLGPMWARSKLVAELPELFGAGRT